MYDNLTQFGPKFAVQPSVAQRWSLSADRLTWTFQLREDLTFSNGEPLTADDVVFSLNLILEKNWPQRAYFPSVTSVTASDARTVLITTRAPDVSVPNSGHFLMILPKKYYESVGDDGFREKPIGSGPYELVRFVREDSTHYRKRATPHPFRRPANDEIIIRYIPETIQMINGITTDQFDLIGGIFTGDQIDQLKLRGMIVINRPGSSVNIMMPQGTYESRNTPLKDIRVRQALNYAVNREQIVQSIFRGYARASGQLLVPDSPSWNDGIPPWPYDVAKAKQLLAQAGYANGFKLQLQMNPASLPQEVALAVQSDLKAVGVEVEIIQLEGATFADYSNGRNNYVKADLFAFGLAESNGMSQFSTIGCNKPVGAAPSANYFCIPEQERLNEQIVNELDPAKRAALMQQATKVVADAVPAIFLLVRDAIFVTSPKTRGFDPPLFNHFHYDSMYKVK
ncbi:MAG: ABC transporter substrate-binding protein [Dehalococcoidia bacterium]|nr:MAG: ABC transporter substrate-binding protein [Dehalococcoidia bacterium]